MKPTVYYPDKIHYVDWVIAEIEIFICKNLFESIEETEKEMKLLISTKEKHSFLSEKLEELKEGFPNKDFLEWPVNFHVDLKNKKMLIDREDIKQHSFKTPSTSKQEDITIFTEDLVEYDFGSNNWNLNPIYDADTYVEKFILLKGQLAINILNYVLFNYFEDQRQKLNYTEDYGRSKTAFFPFYSQTTFEQFKEYQKKHVIEPFIDNSYLFQRLLKENLIHKIPHRVFMEFLKDNNFISEQRFDKFLEKESFRTLSKSKADHRENNFNNIFNI